MVLCKGREDNPIHTDAFNELIENLKRKKSKMELIVNVRLQGRFLWKK